MLNEEKLVAAPSPLHKFYRYARTSGVCGTEVEVEYLRANQQLDLDVAALWNAHHDGSLRHIGVEYTMHKPLTGHVKNKAIIDLCAFITGQPYVADSPRTSVHNHVNVQKRTPLEIWNAITLYWLLEPMLMQHCGEGRIGNPFCLRFLDALNLVDVACSDLQNELPFTNFRGNDDIRYAGLNLQPVRSFGSLEFRGMRGEYDAKLLNTWSDFLVHLVHSSALRWSDPSAIFDEFYGSSREKFFEKVMGDYYDTIGKPYYKKSADEIEEGVEALLPIAYFHDWSAWQAKMERNILRSKEKGNILNDIPPPAVRRRHNVPAAPFVVPAGLHIDNLVDAAVQLRRNDDQPVQQIDWDAADHAFAVNRR